MALSRKKVVQFIDNNFPPYNSCTIIEEQDNKAIAVLEYGLRDKLRVTIGYVGDEYSAYRLLQTEFI